MEKGLVQAGSHSPFAFPNGAVVAHGSCGHVYIFIPHNAEGITDTE